MEMQGAKKSRSSSDTATAGKRSSTRSNNSGSSGTTTPAVERKEIERKRRQQMKSLCVKLASLIPKEDYSRVSVVATTDDRLMTASFCPGFFCSSVYYSY